MDMGEEDLLLDEPWTLTRKKPAVPAGAPRPANPMPQMRPANPAPFPQHSAPANPAPIPQQSPFPSNPAPFANQAQPAFQQSAFGAPAPSAPAPRPAFSAVCIWRSRAIRAGSASGPGAKARCRPHHCPACRQEDDRRVRTRRFHRRLLRCAQDRRALRACRERCSLRRPGTSAPSDSPCGPEAR